MFSHRGRPCGARLIVAALLSGATGTTSRPDTRRIFKATEEAIDAHRVLAGDGKLYAAVVEQPPAQQARLDTKVFPSQVALGGDLPQACGAEDKLVARVVQELARRSGELLGLAGRPEQELGV
jgi:hypothetical protein